MVLLSDTSKEFPNNTSSSFKVQLPEPLQLEDGPWELGLSSLSMPDARLNLEALTDDRTANLFEAAYLLNGHWIKWVTVTMAWVDEHYTVTDGVEFMKMQMWNTQVSKGEFRDGDGLGFRWEGEDLIVNRNTKDLIPSAIGWWAYYPVNKAW